ncbi:MAG: flagellar biosynthesis protein FliQ [Peptococcaceae bacterium]|nr:flagellar biosynthesis protein FliQ [Peptococcaceae bacterium]
MGQSDVLLVFRETIWLILKLAGPLLLVSIVIGLLIAIFQAATQINEQTLTFVPKILAIAFILIVAGSWMLTNLTQFFHYLMNIMAGL